MPKRTTIEIDEDLLDRAKDALKQSTTRGTIEEALRRAVESAAREHEERTGRQIEYLRSLGEHLDLDVLASDEMWR